MKGQWKLIFTLLVVIGMVLFSLQNITQVDVNFFGLAKVKTPLVIVILLSTLIGVFAGMVTSLFSMHANAKQVRKLTKDTEKLTSDNQAKETTIKDLEQQLEHTRKQLAQTQKEKELLTASIKPESVNEADKQTLS